jgi:hypothetical protein
MNKLPAIIILSPFCARKIHLYVIVTQNTATELYKKTGFTIVGTIRDYTCIDNIFLDALIMEWLNPTL